MSYCSQMYSGCVWDYTEKDTVGGTAWKCVCVCVFLYQQKEELNGVLGSSA